MPAASPSAGRSVEWVDSSDSDDSKSVDDETVTPKRADYTGSGEEQHFFPIKATLSSEQYTASNIREEFKSYQKILPLPDRLLQEQHSFEVLREIMIQNDVEIPRFLKLQSEGGIKPHYALCCLLLDEYDELVANPKATCNPSIPSLLVWLFTFGCLYRQNHVPADFIRDQFNRVAHVIPTNLVRPSVLRKQIRIRSLPIPNFFLDPEDDKQFPPHIALLVVLQDEGDESNRFRDPFHGFFWSLFAFLALILRLVLEVIGGAGAIWGGSEVFGLRYDANKELWRFGSIVIGILCFLRFVTLNAPQMEDEGDILGPAGPWSLRGPSRLRAVTEHPFHYFVKAQPPYSPTAEKKKEQ